MSRKVNPKSVKGRRQGSFAKGMNETRLFKKNCRFVQTKAQRAERKASDSIVRDERTWLV